MIGVCLSFLVGQLLSAWWRLGPLPPLGFAACSALIRCLTNRSRGSRSAPAERRRRATAGRWSAFVAAASVGVWLASRASEPPRAGCFLPADDEPIKTWIEADLIDAPSPAQDGVRARTIARVPGHDPERVCGEVLLTIAQPPAGLGFGERVRVHAALRRPRNFANPRAYDARGALARRRVWCTAFATGGGLERRVGPAGGGGAWLAAERQRIGRLIADSLPAIDAALLRSLVVGDEAAVPPEVWDRMAAAGLAHLLSVSGLHIALVWGIAFAIVRWSLSRSEWLLLHAHVRALAALAALAPAVLYAGLAGLSAPAARSVAMTTLFVASLTVGREVRPLRVLCLTAAVLAAVSPGAPLDVSFQLSFASVLALVLAGEAWSRHAPFSATHDFAARLGRRALLALVVPAAALVGTAPLVALHFNRFTLVGLVTNPILVPVAGTPATVLGLAGAGISLVSEPMARGVFALTYWPLELLQFGIRTAAYLPLASIRVPTPTVFELALLYCLFAVAWLPRDVRRAAAAVVLVACALDAGWWSHERWWHPDLRIRFLDVGQGDSAVVEFPGGRVAVIDGGGFGRSRFDVGQRVVAPYLWSRRILRVDYLVATHGDWDHQGGLHFLAREFAPRELWVGPRAEERIRLARLEAAVRDGGGIVRALRAGETALRVGDARVECLHPPGDGALSANDSSLVLRLTAGEHSVLFTGDVEAAGEAAFVSSSRPLAANVLKVPHHGSATSSGEALLEWSKPQVAVFSLAAGNVYGFPHPAVLERYRRFAVRMLRTDRDGSVWVAIDRGRLEVGTQATASPFLCSLFGSLC